jgi:hypothetical protein
VGSKLIDGLLRDAEKWTELQSILRDQVDKAKDFLKAYSTYRCEDEDLDKAETKIDAFERNVSSKITQLDKVSQSLIQIVSIVTN